MEDYFYFFTLGVVSFFTVKGIFDTTKEIFGGVKDFYLSCKEPKNDILDFVSDYPVYRYDNIINRYDDLVRYGLNVLEKNLKNEIEKMDPSKEPVVPETEAESFAKIFSAFVDIPPMKDDSKNTKSPEEHEDSKNTKSPEEHEDSNPPLRDLGDILAEALADLTENDEVFSKLAKDPPVDSSEEVSYDSLPELSDTPSVGVSAEESSGTEINEETPTPPEEPTPKEESYSLLGFFSSKPSA